MKYFDGEVRAWFDSRWWVQISRTLLLLCLLGMVWPPAAGQAQAGFTFPVVATFKSASAPGWVLGGTAVLTSGTTDPAGDGWLRLTTNNLNQAGYAYYNTPIPTGRGLVVTFDYAAWGGTGADGLTFFLFDGATPVFKVGASGGSLGYAQKSGVNGLSGGYLGLGLDEFGNYSNPTEGRVGGTTSVPNAVAIRGPGSGTSGYDYLAGTTRLDRAPWNLPRLDCPSNMSGCGNGTTRPPDTFYSRQVQIVVTPVGAAYQVKVAMKFSKDAPAWTPLFGPFTMPTSAPGTLKMGFAASTGGAYNNHEIRNLSVTQQVPDLTATKAVQNVTTGGGSVAPGDELLYNVLLTNNTNTAIAGVQFTDAIPANTTYVANSASVPYGATLNATAPISVTNITVPANGQVAITFKVRVVSPIALGVTQISNQGGYTYGAVSALTDGDTQSEGAQPTVISVTAGPNFDNATKTVTYEDLDSNGAVSPGDRLTYRVVLPNSGNQDAPSITFADVLPSNTTYVANSATVSNGTVAYNSTTKTLNWTASVAAGSQATLEFKVTVNSGVKIRDVISNQGTVTYGSTSVLTDADLTTPGKQPTQLLAGGGATLTATKSAEVIGGGPAQPGSQLRYTIRLTNTGSYPVAGATFADTIPANTTYVTAATDNGSATYSAPALSVTGINLAKGATATIQLTVQINSPLNDVTQISNQGVVNYDSNQGGVNNTTLQTDGDPATAGQQPTNTTLPNSDLAVTKTLDNHNPAEAGTIVYTVRVANQGPLLAENVIVADPLPAGLTLAGATATAGSYSSPTWTVGSLANGAAATLTLSATVNLGQGGATITNTASASSALYDPSPANNSAGAGLTVRTTTLSGTVVDAVSGAPLVGVTLVITDSLGNLCTATTGAGGAYQVTSGQNGCRLAPGTGAIGATGGAPAGYLLRTVPATIVAGTANTGNLTLVLPSLSGVVTDLGSGVALVGATVTMTQGSLICTTSVGDGGAYTFVAGPGCMLAAGPATVTAALARYQDASATPVILDTGPTRQDLALGTADLLITKDDVKSTVAPGEALDYVIALVNQGSITATGIVVTDTLPPFVSFVDANPPAANPAPGVYVWTPAEIAPGGAISFTLQARVAISLPDGTTRLLNYANLTATSPDRDRTNNEVADVDIVVAHPDLTLFKSATADSSPIQPGSTITYTYVGENRGSAFATGVRITDTLDANTTYVADSAVLVVGESTWPVTASYNSGLHQLLLTLPDMPPGAEGNLRYGATVANPLPAGTTLVTNTAEVTSNELDLDLRDNHSTVVLSAQSGTNLYVQKVAMPASVPALPSGVVLYRLRYGNLSNGIATDAVLSDAIPANTRYMDGSLYRDGVNLSDAANDDAGEYLGASRTISVSLGNLAGGASGVITFTVRIDPLLPAGVATIDNTAYITSTVDDLVPDDNVATAVIEVAAQPDLTIVKSDGNTQVQAGDLITYTIAYSNTGNQAATGVRITDTLLAGIDYLASTPGGLYAAGAGTITWNIGALPVNEMHMLTVTARVKTEVQPGAVVANNVVIADDGANGADINPAGNTFTDSDVAIAPYFVLEKRAAGPVFVGQPVTYTIEGFNARGAPAYHVVVTDTVPANTSVVPGSISSGGAVNGGIVTWDMGDVEPGGFSTVSFAVIPQPGAGGMTQTLPTLSTDAISGTLTITSSTTTAPTGRPWCDFAGCASFMSVYQGENGLPPTGWNDNPRLTSFDDSGWAPPVPSSKAEFVYWVDPAELSAEWVSAHIDAETIGNFTFFRQNFCLPLNATGLSASIQIAGDDISDSYLNGVYLGQEVGAGAADTFDARAAVQPGINLLSVQLLNNRHGGHARFDGGDHSGLLFNLGASYTGLRPFAAAPSSTLAAQPVLFSMTEHALDGRAPYSYTIDYGDSTSTGYQGTGTFLHTYAVAGVYTATVIARSQDGCTGRDQVVVSVLPAGATLLANPVVATYRDANGRAFAAQSGAGVEVLPAADLSIAKTVPSGSRVPGQAVTYQITVTNRGPNGVIGATISDTLPLMLTAATWTCQAGSGSLCTVSGSGDLTDTVNLAAGAILTYSVTGMVPPGATGLLDNSVSVSLPAGVSDLVPGNNRSTDRGPLTPVAVLSMSKHGSPNPGLAPGYAVHYVIRVENAGPSDAVGVLVTDTFPAAITGATWSCTASDGSTCAAIGSGDLADTATILAGGILTYTVTGDVDADAQAGSPLSNSATARFAGVPVTATDDNTLVAPTTLAASKVALDGAGNASHTMPFDDRDTSGGISPGDTLKYRVTLRTGASAAYNVRFTDSPAANTRLVIGSVTCDSACTVLQGNAAPADAVTVFFASLAANSTATIDYQVAIDAVLPFQVAALANQGLVACANAPAIATDDPATSEANDPTVVTLTMGSVRGVVWADDGDGMFESGEPLLPDVTVTLSYTDVNAAVQSISVNTDANGAYTFTVLAAGEYQIGVTVREGFKYGAIWGGDKDNKIDPLTGHTPVINLAANQQLANIGAGQISVLAFGYLPASFANTTLVHDGARHSVPDAVGDRLYLGSGIVTGIDGVESPTASGPGDGIMRAFTPAWAVGGNGVLTVTASGAGLLWGWFDWDASGQFDPGEAQDLGAVITGTQAVTVMVGASYTDGNPLFARFRLYTAGYALDVAATAAVYNGEVEDYGWYAIRGIVFEDANGNGVQDAGEGAPAGATVVITDSRGVVQQMAPNASGLYTAALIAGGATVDVRMPPSYLQVAGTNPTTITVGVATDAGSDGFLAPPRIIGTVYDDRDFDGVYDAGETGLAGVSLTTGAAVATTDANGVYTFTLMPGTYTITETNLAGYLSTGDISPPNDDVIPSVTVSSGQTAAGKDFYDTLPADLSLTKVVDTLTPWVGDAVVFTVTVSNAGPAVAAVRVADALPDGYAYVGSAATAGSYDAGTQQWTLPELRAGGDATLLMTATVKANGSYINYAEIAASDRYDPDSTPGDRSADQDDDDSVTPVPRPVSEARFDPALRVVVGPGINANFVAGDDILFGIELHNQGATPMQNVTLVDYLPPGMSLSPVDSNGWQAAGDRATLVVAGPIAPGQMTTVAIVLRVGDAFAQVVNAVEIVRAQDATGTLRADADAVNDDVNGNDPVIDDYLDGDGVNDEDDHDIAAFFVERVDVALAKRVADGQPSPVRAGDDVRYTLTITNQGSATIGEVVVCDHLPAGFVLSPNDDGGWSIGNDGAATRTVQGPLAAGQVITVDILLRVQQVTPGTARNWAEILAIRDPEGRDLVDSDSLPDNGDIPEDDTGDASIEVAQAPTAIQLDSFDVSAEQGAAMLRWRTADETGLQGFLLYRSTDDQFGHALLITPALIPAAGVPGAYLLADPGVVEGQSYWYWLGFVRVTQEVEYYGPRSFLIAGPGAGQLFLPIVAR